MSIRLKTVLGVALIEAILLALLVYTTMKYMHENLEEALIKRADTTAMLFSSTAKDPVLAYDLASLETFSAELAGNVDIVHVRTRSPDGFLLASAGDSATVDEPFIEDHGLESVVDGVYDVSAPIAVSGVEYGRVEIGFDIASIEDSLAESRQLSTLIAVVEMVLVAIFSFALGTYLTRQLKVLRQAARRVSRGDYSLIPKVDSGDEVGDVALAFNQMASVLKESRQTRDRYESELVELNQTLEQRVLRRTEQINAQYEELKIAHQQLADAQAKLLQAEKLASIGQLSAGIAHEINNPISFVNSNAHSLAKYIAVYQKLLAMYRSVSMADTEAAAAIRDRIAAFEAAEDIDFVTEDIDTLITDTIEGAVRVQEIVKGLRDFSHTNHDTKMPCDVIECTESTLRILTAELKTRCEVRTAFKPIPPVLANRGELNQVIMNLLVNAGQSMSDFGEVLVSTDVLDEQVVLSITDNGRGIEPENIGKLFDPFYTTKPVGEGTGLGLSISYGIITDHDGTIVVESNPGQGSTFKIYLPILKSDPAAEAA
ncbi:sensor histidine kinase [Granulosicoccus sp. 3-233]|uniref:sensor histidine kinase n=1 Tax=Granulosicoccus sp. 3-233 TaxID=3417969 RepID=UPI003D354CC8